MLSKSQASFVKSLHQKKFRRQHGLFIIEGIKSIQDFATSGFRLHSVYFTPALAGSLNTLPANIKLFEVNTAELEKISALQHPQGMLAIAELPGGELPAANTLKGRFTLVLDGVQDPGNLGTIIRTADWFGIGMVICSDDTVEAYNPKTVQATMGSLSRVKVFYTNLEEFFISNKLPVFGAYLEGDNIYRTQWGDEGLILLGNEGQGISPALKSVVTHKLTIPRGGHAESLNVAVSASIFCSEVFRSTTIL